MHVLLLTALIALSTIVLSNTSNGTGYTVSHTEPLLCYMLVIAGAVCCVCGVAALTDDAACMLLHGRMYGLMVLSCLMGLANTLALDEQTHGALCLFTLRQHQMSYDV